MSWSSVTDQIVKAGVDAFGETVTYKPAVGTQYDIKGVFGRITVEETAGQTAAMVGFRTTVGVRRADLQADPAIGDQIIFNSVTYNVISSEEDGGGGILLILQKS